MKTSSNLKWILSVIFLSLLVRVFLISIYRIPTNVMQPSLISGDIIMANQLSYGLRLPWMQSGYFESDPEIGDIIVYQIKNKSTDEISIKRIVQKTEFGYVVENEGGLADPKSAVSIDRDQILSKAFLIVLSVGSTQDSISSQKSIRWNRFLTLIH